MVSGILLCLRQMILLVNGKPLGVHGLNLIVVEALLKAHLHPTTIPTIRNTNFHNKNKPSKSLSVEGGPLNFSGNSIRLVTVQSTTSTTMMMMMISSGSGTGGGIVTAKIFT